MTHFWFPSTDTVTDRACDTDDCKCPFRLHNSLKCTQRAGSSAGSTRSATSVRRRPSCSSELRWTSGTNCIQIGLPGKLIFSKRKGLWESPILFKIVSENRFSGKTYFYTIVSREGAKEEAILSPSDGEDLARGIGAVGYRECSALAKGCKEC